MMNNLMMPNVKKFRKTSLQLAKESFEKSQALSITKAVNPSEVPVKQKHVRAVIMGTFHEMGASTFWSVAKRLPLRENRIVAWKFCHVLHKVLREGHPGTLEHSYKNKDILINMGQLWKHLQDGYGKLIELYCQLLVTKLTFHRRNPRLPGNLVVSHVELEKIYEKEVNNYFQISVEMFDHLDAILNLQTSIFQSMDMSKSNSMTNSGQCRLAPLIPCIQDASRLYDICVKVLFELHAELPADTLSGHRDRFLKQFNELNRFYDATSTMHYFRNLITVPTLSKTPPNFLKQAELKTYVAPKEVIIPNNEDNESNFDNRSEILLIDTSSNGHSNNDGNTNHTTNNTINHNNVNELLVEKDSLISHLQNQLSLAKMDICKNQQEYDVAIDALKYTVNELERKSDDLQNQLEEEKQSKEAIFKQVSQISQTQDTQKSKEEKFEKLKEVYSNLREEHIQLIRKKAEVDKNCSQIEKARLILAEEKLELLTKINQFITEKRESDDVKNEVDYLKYSFEQEKQDFMKMIEQLKENINDLSEYNEKLVTSNESMNAKMEGFNERFAEKITEIESLQLKCNKSEDVINSGLDEAKSLIRHTLEEIDNPALSAMTCTPDYLITHSQIVEKCLDTSRTSLNENLPHVYRLTYLFASHLIYTKATSNSSPNVAVSEKITMLCKSLGANLLKLLSGIKCNDNDSKTEGCIHEIENDLHAISDLAETLQGVLKDSSLEILPELLENELQAMEQAIEQATKTIQDLMKNCRQADTGLKLEVNEKILDNCEDLMNAIKKLVLAAKQLQVEIVSQGRGSSTAREFYTKNHRWTDGLISAAKAVATAANFFLSVADEIVNGRGKLEKLVVAAQEIAASTAQLVVASRVKADRKSANLIELSSSSKLVSKATASIVATVKDCGQLLDEAELDTSGLSLHSTKRLEMDTQVRVLELDKELQQERLKLAALRRHHYQLDKI